MREERLPAEAGPATAGQSSGPGRPSAVAAHEKTVAEPLADEQRMKSPEVLRRLNKRGYRRGKTAVHELVERLRPQAARPIRRFEGVAGELGQHHFRGSWRGYVFEVFRARNDHRLAATSKRQFVTVPDAQTRYAGNCEEALQLPLDSGYRRSRSASRRINTVSPVRTAALRPRCGHRALRKATSDP